MTGPRSSSACWKVERSAFGVVPRDEPDVGDPEVLEQPARLGEVHDRRAQALAELADRRADGRDPADQLVVLRLARLPGAGELDLAQVGRQAADRRADRHLVVVEHDQELRLALADVVERLEAQPARDRGVADDDGDPLRAAAEVAGGGQPLPDREPGAGVPAVEDVVGRLAPPREPADAAELAERPEPLEPARQELVRIGLVAGVPDDPVARRLEEAVQGDRELDDAEAAAEMAAGRRDGGDDRLADLRGEPVEVVGGQGPEVGRAGQRRQDRWLVGHEGSGSRSSHAGGGIVARRRKVASSSARLGARIVDGHVREAGFGSGASGCGRTSRPGVPRAQGRLRARAAPTALSGRLRMWDRGAGGTMTIETRSRHRCPRPAGRPASGRSGL